MPDGSFQASFDASIKQAHAARLAATGPPDPPYPTHHGPRLPGFYADRAKVREAYATLLESLPWDYFVTQTYRRLHRDTIHAPAAWWQSIAPVHPRRAFVAVEPHRLDGIHLHTLVRFPRGAAEASLFHRLDLRRDLKAEFGITDVVRAKSTAAVANYCAKYVTKGNLNYEFYGDAASWSPAADLPPVPPQLPMFPKD